MESDCYGENCDDSDLLGRADGIPAKHDPSIPKLIGINAVVFALELCASSGFSYIPPLLLRAGCSETTMSFIIGIGEPDKWAQSYLSILRLCLSLYKIKIIQLKFIENV